MANADESGAIRAVESDERSNKGNEEATHTLRITCGIYLSHLGLGHEGAIATLAGRCPNGVRCRGLPAVRTNCPGSPRISPQFRGLVHLRSTRKLASSAVPTMAQLKTPGRAFQRALSSTGDSELRRGDAAWIHREDYAPCTRWFKGQAECHSPKRPIRGVSTYPYRQPNRLSLYQSSWPHWDPEPGADSGNQYSALCGQVRTSICRESF